MPTHEELERQLERGPARPARGAAPAPDVARTVADPGAPSHQAVFELQRLAGNAVVSRLLGDGEQTTEGRSPVLDVVGKGDGRPLDVGIRREMEASLGADFSDVRLHVDGAASESARAVNANAYTVGSDVVIRGDRFAPDSVEGKKTIAHELTHVIQQRSGPVAGRETGTGIRLSDPGDEFEQAAERTASAVVAGAAGAPSTAAAGAGAGAAQLERDEEAAAQGEFVQRQGEEEQEDEEGEAAAQGEFVQRDEEEEKQDEEAAAQGEFVQRDDEEEKEEEQAPGGA